MSTRVYPVILRHGESGKFIAECPNIVGCLTQGDTIDEALANIREAIELCLEDMRGRGLARSGLGILERSRRRSMSPALPVISGAEAFELFQRWVIG